MRLPLAAATFFMDGGRFRVWRLFMSLSLPLCLPCVLLWNGLTTLAPERRTNFPGPALDAGVLSYILVSLLLSA